MVTINGTDLETIGLIASARRLPRFGGENATVPLITGAVGGVRAGGTVPDGRLVIMGHITRDTHALLLTALDSFVAAVQRECVIRFSDITDREWVGHLSANSSIDPTRLDWVGEWAPFTLEFVLPDPSARGQADTELVGTNPTLALGTAPSRLNVEIENGVGAAITAVVVRVRDASNANLTELQWTGSIGSGETFVLRTDPAFEITVNDANEIDGRLVGASYPIADPRDGADDVQVVLTGGATPTVTTTYRKRWF